jgi:hypothetical protein
MSSPVCPSAFTRFAVAMCSSSSTLRGRPNLVPLAREPSFDVQHVATAASGEPASDSFGEPCGGLLGCRLVGVPIEPVHPDGSHVHFLTCLVSTERDDSRLLRVVSRGEGCDLVQVSPFNFLRRQ